MRNIRLKIHGFLILMLLVGSFVNAQTVFLFEDFENIGIPAGWQEEKVKGKVGQGDVIVSWVYQAGGEGSHPLGAASGTKNALFWFDSPNSEETKLVTPSMKLKDKVKPEIRFYHAQKDYPPYPNDELRVYCKKAAKKPWIKLGEFTANTPSWTKRTVQIPDSLLTDSVYVAFEGTTHRGHGVCIDSIYIHETAQLDRTIQTITINQASTDFIPSGSKDVPILRIDMIVIGNTSSLLFNSINVNSLNQNDDYILPSGVKLYYTTGNYFTRDRQIGSATSFVAGGASFTGLNLDLPSGENYLWVTFDIASGTDTIHGSLVDASVLANSISIGTATYPSTTQSPAGTRIINESIFFDNYETLKGWIFPVQDSVNEFQIDTTCTHCIYSSIGGAKGNPDPKYAYSGTKILGTDLTRLGNRSGDYERLLNDGSYKAVSPAINCSYYKDLNLSFQRWLNVEAFDRVNVDISSDNGVNWSTIYTNGGSFITDNKWTLTTLNINNYAFNKSQVKIRYTLGSTNAQNDYSGWNIDDFVITGDYITKDIGVSKLLKPESGCDHTDHDTIKIKIKNYGAKSVTGQIPLKVFFGAPLYTEVLDTFNGTIGIGQEITFTFKRTVDLSSPVVFAFGDVYAHTKLTGDEDPTSDTLYTSLSIIPTYTLPYANDFESNDGYWQSDKAAMWEFGTPSKLVVNGAASGANVWATKLIDYYYVNDTAHLESPCFNLSGIRHPILELNYISNSEDSTDGVALYYTANAGSTWNHCDTHSYSFNWPWYNYRKVAALDSMPGWSGTVPSYSFVKQILPVGISKKSNAQLRMTFRSNDVDFYEGFAFDDIRIYDAPNDLGVSKIVSPVNACELLANQKVTVAIKNFNIDTLKTGYKFLLTVEVNGVRNTDTLSARRNVKVGDTLQYKMNYGFNMYQAGTYQIAAWTNSFEFDNIYADTAYNNDTSRVSILVRKPFVELGNDVYTVHADTVKLNANAGADVRYLWNNGRTTDTSSVTKAGGRFTVIITDTVTSCLAKDTIDIVRLIADVGVSEIVKPISACELSDTVSMLVQIKNYGTDTIRGYNIVVAYSIDAGAAEEDTFTISQIIYPDSTFNYRFKKKVDMLAVKKYSFQAYTRYADDDSIVNDTAQRDVKVWGYPAFSLTPADTIHIGTRFRLNAAKGDTIFKSFLWSDTTTDSTLLVTTPGSGYYACTVTSVHGCSSADTSMVRLVIQDVRASAIYHREKNCGPIHADTAVILVNNVGTDTLNIGDKIPLTYKYVNTLIDDTLLLSTRFYPGDSIYYKLTDTFTINILGANAIKAYTRLDRDSIRSNDSSAFLTIIYPAPFVTLGRDTIVNARQYVLNAGTGYTSYLWQDGSTLQSITATIDNAYPSLIARVSTTDTNGCVDMDTSIIQLNYTDMFLKKLLPSDTACGFNATYHMSALFVNRGTTTIPIITIISIIFDIDSSGAVEEIFSVPKILLPLDSFTYTFISNPNIFYNQKDTFNVYFDWALDTYKDNDTLLKVIQMMGRPEVKWKTLEDSIFVAFPYTLTTETSYSTYKWDNGSTASSFNVTQQKWQHVTITDRFGCANTDSIFIGNESVGELHFVDFSLEVDPNPTSDFVQMSLIGSEPNDYSISLLNEVGVLVIHDELRSILNVKRVYDLSNLPSGIYYLIVRKGSNNLIRKIVKN